MKNFTVKLLTLSILILTSACSDSGFPSLVHQYSPQEEPNAAARRSLNGSAGTFAGQKMIAFRQKMDQIKLSYQNNLEKLTQISAKILADSNQYEHIVSEIKNKRKFSATSDNSSVPDMLKQAQNKLETVAVNIKSLNNLSLKTANNAAAATDLLNSIRTTFKTDETDTKDQRQLQHLQQQTEQLLTDINKTNTEIKADLAHRQQYLSSVQKQINGLDSAAGTGESHYSEDSATSRPVLFGNSPASNSRQTGEKPSFVAKFKRDNISYKEGLSTVVKAAVNRKSNTTFEVVAVSNASEQQKALQHAEKIIEDIADMGISPDNIHLNIQNSNQVEGAEVWVFAR